MKNINKELNLTETIIHCVIVVHSILGPGFLESIYQNALALEIDGCGLRAEKEKPVNVYYKGTLVGTHRPDIIVNDAVILELKTVESLTMNHYTQLRSYLKATGIHLGLLVNFTGVKADFRRVEIQ